MTQHASGVDLDLSVGYLLKEAATALRVAMEEALRPLGMTVTHYACLELLAQRPGMSNSELARGAFVTRQSMNVLLQHLEREGQLERESVPARGRVLPVRLTEHGRRAQQQASRVVREVEVAMLAGLSPADQADALRLLRSMVTALRPRHAG